MNQIHPRPASATFDGFSCKTLSTSNFPLEANKCVHGPKYSQLGVRGLQYFGQALTFLGAN